VIEPVAARTGPQAWRFGPEGSIKGSIPTALWRLCKCNRKKKPRFAGLLQSPLTDSNRRPPPYQEVGERMPVHVSMLGRFRQTSGGGGIRTHEALARPTTFKAVAFDHSATPPGALVPTIDLWGCQNSGPTLRVRRFTGGTEFWHPHRSQRAAGPIPRGANSEMGNPLVNGRSITAESMRGPPASARGPGLSAAR
jgi:hypothetical protein